VNAVVELRKVGKRYGSGDNAVQALCDADLRVHAGEVLLIQGPSGSGKTTLLSILGLLMRPTSGQVVVDGQVASGLAEKFLPALRARNFGFVFQGFNLFAALTALENVAIATRLKNRDKRAADLEARRLLAAVGLADRMDHRPEELSGGQKQRVAIARALGGAPPVILGDEPTAAIDSKTALQIMALLHGLAHNEGRAVVVVTHDARLERYADRVVAVEDGRVAAGRPGAAAEGASS
jgi:putative ABC transport system ATP-binding protein